MEDDLKSKIGFSLFVLVVLFIAIGGFIFMKRELKDKDEKKNEEKTVSYKIDEDKDFIYYKNFKTISEEAEIDYKDVVINLKSQEALTKSLQDENEIYTTNIKYISKEGINSEIINYNNDDLYALTFRTYANYEYNNYVSLVVKDYDYSCFDFIKINKTKGYVFNTKTGNLISEDKLLLLFNTSMKDIKDQITVYLTLQQMANSEIEIKIPETVNELKDYALYIDNYGSLYISFLVKSSEGSYNVDMEVVK